MLACCFYSLPCNPIITTRPNEFIHIDTTFWPLPNGIKAAIIFVCDNFSKTILGWNVSLKKDGENAKAALQNAIEKLQKYRSEERRVGKECRFRWWPKDY